MKIITGSAGFIGSALRERLLADGIDCWGVDLKYGADLTTSFNFMSRAVDTVFHLAGCSDAYQNPAECFRVNLVSTMNILNAIIGTPVRLIFASTYLTDGVYAESKRSCEDLINLYAKRFGVQACIVNCCNVYGPGDHNKGRVIPSLISKMLAHEPVKVNICTRTFAYIDDVVDAYVRLDRAGELPPITGISTSDTIHLRDLAFKLGVLTGTRSKVNPGERGSDPVCRDAAPLSQLGWEPKVSLDEGLRRTIEWWRSL